jgi:exonuclease V
VWSKQGTPNMAETSSSDNNNNNNIPIEIVSDEEMAFIEAAYASISSSSAILSRSLSSSTPSSSPRLLHQNNLLSINSITLLSKRNLSSSTSCDASADIEDTLQFSNSQKKPNISDSFLRRFRNKRALSVTDLTSTVPFFFISYLIEKYEIELNGIYKITFFICWID